MREFIQKRLVSNDTDFYEPLSKLKVSTFPENTKTNEKVDGKEMAIKADRALSVGW